MEIKEKTKSAAHAARDMINSGESVSAANKTFNEIAGFYLSHSGKRDFIRLLNWYADEQ
nr:hypothetical protein [uncultured Enterobacter sp.]DAI86994.1 MAG TPA: hypothetical protein [Caudoviricetes sp.]